MAVVTRGRVVRPVDAEGATRIAGSETDKTTRGTHRNADLPRARHMGRVVPRTVVDAHSEAERIVRDARTEAAEVLRTARLEAEGAIRAAADDARAAAVADLAACYVAMRAREEHRAEGDLERTSQLAVVLAERLVRGAIEADPSRMAAMARGALSEVRGARRAIIELHPLDADAVQGHLEEAGLPREAIELRRAPDFSRGDLRLHTDLGTLDARLTVQLERLANALKDALRG